MQVALSAALPGALIGQGQQPSAASEITASGVAEIRVPPDHAIVTTTVETRDRTATAASSTNAVAATNIMQALRKAGLAADAVTTSDFTVDQYYPPRFDAREPPLPDGFITRTVIRAETGDIGKVSGLIDAALTAGATRISVQYSSSKMADARRTALETAFIAARADAVALAQAAGGSLGRLLSVAPNGASPAVQLRGVSSVLMGIAGGVALSPAPPLAPGNLTSNVLVSARWEFVPGGAR